MIYWRCKQIGNDCKHYYPSMLLRNMHENKNPPQGRGFIIVANCCTYFLPHAYFQRSAPVLSGWIGSHLILSELELNLTNSPSPIFPER